MRKGIINSKETQVKRKSTLFIVLRSLFVDELRTTNYKLILILLFITLLRGRICWEGNPAFASNRSPCGTVTSAAPDRLPPSGLAAIFVPPESGGLPGRPGIIDSPDQADGLKLQYAEFHQPENKPAMARENIDPSTSLRVDWLDKLINQIWQVESDRQLWPKDGDGGKAIGPLQIHADVLKDVNKYYGTQFEIADLREIKKAKLIAQVYIEMWLDRHKEEIAARIFNGGPRGWNSASTDGYWKKIENLELRTQN